MAIRISKTVFHGIYIVKRWGIAVKNSTVAELFNELIRFETELWDAVELQLWECHNLLLSWFEPMQVIERTANCRVSDIVSALSITVGGASKLVDRIEAAGFCRRRLDAADGRSSILELTAAGKKNSPTRAELLLTHLI